MARMYDYYLGGKDNFAADRDAAEQIRKIAPELTASAWSNRRFHQRAAAWIARNGIGQFIDIGCGLPTMQNTHEVVQSVSDSAKVAYLDYDPVVVLHAQALLAKRSDNVTVIRADVRDPAGLIAAIREDGLIDLDQPCGVLITAVMHFIPDAAEPHRAIARLMAATAPGSYLQLTHVTADGQPEAKVDSGLQIYRSASAMLIPRTKAEVARFFDRLDLVPPWPAAGPQVVSVAQWGLAEPPDPAQPVDKIDGSWWAGVARKP